MWRSLRRRIGSAAQVQSFRADCALRTTGDAFRTSAQNGTYGAAAPAAGPMRTEPLGRGLGQHAARGKPTSSVTAEVALPYNLPYKSRHLPSSAIVARLQQGRSGPVSPSRVIPSNPLYRFHTAEVGGSSPLAPTPKGRESKAGPERRTKSDTAAAAAGPTRRPGRSETEGPGTAAPLRSLHSTSPLGPRPSTIRVGMRAPAAG
jgi:hypothetical protein